MTNDLIKRLEAATGPSRELDAEIARANGWTQIGPGWRSPAGQIRPQPPRYTEIINDAMTLVLPIDGPGRGLWIRLEAVAGAYGTSGSLWHATIWGIIGDESFSHQGFHIYPAIALLIAIEKAKEDSKP